MLGRDYGQKESRVKNAAGSVALWQEKKDKVMKVGDGSEGSIAKQRPNLLDPLDGVKHFGFCQKNSTKPLHGYFEQSWVRPCRDHMSTWKVFLYPVENSLEGGKNGFWLRISV